jgi:hypothetical protein
MTFRKFTTGNGRSSTATDTSSSHRNPNYGTAEKGPL